MLHQALSHLTSLDQIAEYRALYVKNDVDVERVDPKEVLTKYEKLDVSIDGLIKLPSVHEVHRRNAEFRD